MDEATSAANLKRESSTTIKHEIAQYIAEFLGTFFLVFFGCGSIIIAEINDLSTATIPFVFGGTVMIMIYAVGHISGAHFNPAVTIAFWTIKKFPSSRVLGYLFFQFFGALIASTIHLMIWRNNHSFGTTVPQLEILSSFFIEMILSFVLMFVIVSVATDSRAVGELAGIAIGATVSICALVGGPLTAASMNPARSLGPAILSGNLGSLWLYMVAPTLGAILGALTYNWIRCQKENLNDTQGCC